MIGLKSRSWYNNLSPVDRGKYPPMVGGYLAGYAYCEECLPKQEKV